MKNLKEQTGLNNALIINKPTAAAIGRGGPHAGVDAEPVVKREHVDCGRPAVRQH